MVPGNLSQGPHTCGQALLVRVLCITQTAEYPHATFLGHIPCGSSTQGSFFFLRHTSGGSFFFL